LYPRLTTTWALVCSARQVDNNNANSAKGILQDLIRLNSYANVVDHSAIKTFGSRSEPQQSTLLILFVYLDRDLRLADFVEIDRATQLNRGTGLGSFVVCVEVKRVRAVVSDDQQLAVGFDNRVPRAVAACRRSTIGAPRGSINYESCN